MAKLWAGHWLLVISHFMSDSEHIALSGQKVKCVNWQQDGRKVNQNFGAFWSWGQDEFCKWHNPNDKIQGHTKNRSIEYSQFLGFVWIRNQIVVTAKWHSEVEFNYLHLFYLDSEHKREQYVLMECNLIEIAKRQSESARREWYQ